MEIKDLKFNCKYFKGYMPCEPNKLHDVACNDCSQNTTDLLTVGGYDLYNDGDDPDGDGICSETDNCPNTSLSFTFLKYARSSATSSLAIS